MIKYVNANIRFISQYPLFVEPFRSSSPIFLSFSISRYIDDSLTFNNLDIVSLEILLFFFISSRTRSCLVVITSSASFLASLLASFSASFLAPLSASFLAPLSAPLFVLGSALITTTLKVVISSKLNSVKPFLFAFNSLWTVSIPLPNWLT